MGGGTSENQGARPGRRRRPRPQLGDCGGCALISPASGSPSRRPAVRLHSAGALWVPRAPRPLYPARRRRPKRESERQRAPHPASGPPLSLTPLLPPPSSLPGFPARDPRPQCWAEEPRCSRRGGRLRRRRKTRLSHPVPQPDSGWPRSPAALGSWQAGSLALPLTRSGHASAAATANPRSAPVRLLHASPNQYALLSVDQLAPLSATRASPPLISLLQSPEALRSVPPASPYLGSSPKFRPLAAPSWPQDLLLLGPQPELIPRRQAARFGQ